MKYGWGMLLELRKRFCWLVALCACGLAAVRAPAQQASQPAAQTGVQSSAAVVPAAMHGVIQLDGPWRFQMGDDPRWSDPGLDDSSWPAVVLGKSLAEQGFESYAGYAWYRLEIPARDLHLSRGIGHGVAPAGEQLRRRAAGGLCQRRGGGAHQRNDGFAADV